MLRVSTRRIASLPARSMFIQSRAMSLILKDHKASPSGLNGTSRSGTRLFVKLFFPISFTRQYSAHATAKGAGRNGEVTSGNLNLRLAMPKELGGMGNGSNPEQLFAMGYSGTFIFFTRIFDFFFPVINKGIYFYLFYLFRKLVSSGRYR